MVLAGAMCWAQPTLPSSLFQGTLFPFSQYSPCCLKLEVLLSQPSARWDCRSVPPSSAGIRLSVLGRSPDPVASSPDPLSQFLAPLECALVIDKLCTLYFAKLLKYCRRVRKPEKRREDHILFTKCK